MKLKVFKYCAAATFLMSGTLVSCVADNNSPGLEYMPDMYRSPSVEAYVDYGEVRGVYSKEAQELIGSIFTFVPPAGTIDYQGKIEESYMMPYQHGAPMDADKTHGLYGVKQDVDGLEAAKLDVNPILLSSAVAKEGKVLYERFCIHCHGGEGDGQGTMIKNSNGKYPPPPAYKIDMTAGEMYYIITYGKNAMGSHASQLSPKERWEVIHYVESLTGKGKAAGQSDGTQVNDSIANPIVQNMVPNVESNEQK